MVKFLKYALSLAALTLVAYQLDWSAVGGSLDKLQWWSLPAAVLLQILSFSIGVFRWKLLLQRQNVEYPAPRLIPPYFASAFLSLFLPSSTGGDIYRIFHIHQARHGVAAAFSPVIMERVLGLTTMLLIASTAYWFYPGDNLVILQVGRAAVAFFLGLGLFLVALGIPVIYWPMHRFLERWTRYRPVKGFLEVAEAIHACIKQPSLVAQIMLLSALMHSGMIALFGVLGLGVGAHISPASYALTVPLILVAAGLPITVGGLGVREAAAITLLSSAGMLRADAAVVAILYIPTLLLASMPGLFFFLAYKRSEIVD